MEETAHDLVFPVTLCRVRRHICKKLRATEFVFNMVATKFDVLANVGLRPEDDLIGWSLGTKPSFETWNLNMFEPSSKADQLLPAYFGKVHQYWAFCQFWVSAFQLVGGMHSVCLQGETMFFRSKNEIWLDKRGALIVYYRLGLSIWYVKLSIEETLAWALVAELRTPWGNSRLYRWKKDRELPVN